MSWQPDAVKLERSLPLEEEEPWRKLRCRPEKKGDTPMKGLGRSQRKTRRRFSREEEQSKACSSSVRWPAKEEAKRAKTQTPEEVLAKLASRRGRGDEREKVRLRRSRRRLTEQGKKRGSMRSTLGPDRRGRRWATAAKAAQEKQGSGGGVWGLVVGVFDLGGGGCRSTATEVVEGGAASEDDIGWAELGEGDRRVATREDDGTGAWSQEMGVEKEAKRGGRMEPKLHGFQEAFFVFFFLRSAKPASVVQW